MEFASVVYDVDVDAAGKVSFVKAAKCAVCLEWIPRGSTPPEWPFACLHGPQFCAGCVASLRAPLLCPLCRASPRPIDVAPVPDLFKGWVGCRLCRRSRVMSPASLKQHMRDRHSSVPI